MFRSFLFLVIVSLIVAARAEQPTVVLGQKSGPPLPVIRAQSGGFLDFSIQTSMDFKHWTPRIDVFANLVTVEITDRTVDSESSAVRYYKAGDIANSPVAMLSKWQALGISHYQYDFTRVCGCTPAVLTARVTVENDQVISVEDAQPYMTTMSDFKTVDQIFEVFIDQLNIADLLTIHYNAAWFFPEWLEINQDYFVEDEVQYRIDHFLAIP
jgi:hypothetical protein